MLVGGAGGDIIKSGSANDKVFTGSYAAIGECDTGSGTPPRRQHRQHRHRVGHRLRLQRPRLRHHGVDGDPDGDVFGGGADDVLTGGLGTDKIYGGPGDDYVVAAPATVGAPGSVDDVLGSARR